MDELNSCVGNTQLFPILQSWDFFNHAGVAPLPSTAVQAMIDYAHHIEAQAYLNADWHAQIDQTRTLAATLLHCDKTEIAFIKNTSEGMSTVANGIDWRQGDRIVTTNVEYPANVYPWMNLAFRYGVELIMVPEETNADGRKIVPLEAIIDAAKPARTKLIALSHVEFASGQRHDLKTIGAFCRQRGILFSVDAIQSLGAVPVDVAEMEIDYLSADGHKWLLSPEAAGIFYCRKDLLEKTRPLTVGWLNMVNATSFMEGKYDFRLRPDSGRFESGSLNTAGLLAMKESLKLITGIGVAAISQRLRDLGNRLIVGVKEKGYIVASPREEQQWSGIISFASPKHPQELIAAKLRKDHRVEIAVRHGRFRCSPHFYNTEAQIDRLVDLLPGH